MQKPETLQRRESKEQFWAEFSIVYFVMVQNIIINKLIILSLKVKELKVKNTLL